MLTGKKFRCWILGLSCTMVPLGCANGPANSTGGLFSWFRSRPLTERELEHQEQHQASKKLQDPAHLHLKYAQWRETVGDLADARQSYHFALKENPKSMEAKLGLARLDQLAGRVEEAEEGFQEALKSRPGDPQALNALGQFYASQRLWNKALPLLEEAADVAPHELTFRYHLAVATAQSGDINSAFPHFQHAVGEAEAHYNIGYLLYEKGHKELARQRFQKAIALNPKLIQAQALLDEMDAKKKDIEVADAPMPRATSNPVRHASAAQLPPVQRVEHATLSQESAWPTSQPTGPVPQAAPPIVPATPFSAQPPVARQMPPVQPPVAQHVPVAQPVPTVLQPVPTTAQAPVAQPPVAQPPVAQHTLPLHAPAVTQAPVADPPAVPKAPAPIASPPAFRATRKQNWKQTETPNHAPEFLPPYQPNAASSPAPGTPVLTPPITPAQREQWENQMKALP